jgi:hypothetical protein
MMAITGPAAASSQAPARLAITWAKGVLRDNTPGEVLDIVRHFRPDEVPVLDHHHGEAVGWLRAVRGYGSDIWFTARIEPGDISRRLARGPVSVSLDMTGRNVRLRPDERGIRLPGDLLGVGSFRGRVAAQGYTLTAVAVLPDFDRPGARGSVLWAVEP